MRFTRSSIGTFILRTLYIDPACFSGPSDECCVIAVSPFLRELILAAVRLPRLYPMRGAEERLLAVLLDQLLRVSMTSLQLPIPENYRVKKIYKPLSARPDDNRTLNDWGSLVGATGRTLARRFRVDRNELWPMATATKIILCVKTPRNERTCNNCCY